MVPVTVAVPARFYLPALDGLRFLAFLAVFVAHAAPKRLRDVSWLGPVGRWLDAAVPAGLFGVDLFFVLSAYLITGLLLREAESRGRVNVGAFYLRRALRIWPLYYVALGLTVFVVPHLITDDFSRAHAIAFALFAGNWSTVLWGAPDSVASPLWSISVEEQFYLVWPLLLTVVGVRRLPHLALCTLAVAFATRAGLLLLGGPHDFWNNTFTRLDPIALGALVAVWTRRGLPALSPVARGALAGAGGIVWIAMAQGLPGPLGSFVIYPLVSLGSTAMLVAALGSGATLLAWRPVVYLGRISYGLYVFHLFAITLERQRGPVLASWTATVGLQLGLAFVLTVALAVVSYHLIERPFLMLKARVTVVPSRPD